MSSRFGLDNIERIIVLAFFIQDVSAHLSCLLVEVRVQETGLAYLESFLALLSLI